jgi:hypothetical protein
VILGFPVPREQFAELIGWVAICHALEDIGDVCGGLDIIEPGSLD